MCNKERAPFGALASCFFGVNLYGSIALLKTLDKFYEENRSALLPKEPGRMEQILNQLQPPELLAEFNELVAKFNELIAKNKLHEQADKTKESL